MDEFPAVDDTWLPDAFSPYAAFDPFMENAVDMMKDHIGRRSRAPSPRRVKQTRSWYSAPPGLYMYDQDTINILLNLSRNHISTTFAVFSDFEANHDTRTELCLAMAAVGGLYCTAHAGTEVAKMLFNDARRLLLEEYLLRSSLSFDEAASFTETFILLEIYGLCSGDKRAYEFIEVFHASKLHAFSSCIDALPREDILLHDRHRRAGLLAEALRVLDSFRVLLLQRPPSFVELPPRNITPSSSHGAAAQPVFQTLPSGGLIAVSATTDGQPPASDMHQLATIICYSWMANAQGTESSPSPLWRAEFVEIALDRWVQAQAAATEPPHRIEPSQMLLYHLTQVSLHSDLGNLRRLTKAIVESANPSPPESGGSGGVDVFPDSARAWRSSRHFGIARWHAETILRIVQEGMAAPRRRGSSVAGSERPRFAEAPHLPLCIYFATLIVWCGDVGSKGGGDPYSGDSCIEAGMQLLSRLKVPVSRLLGNALSELLYHEN